MTALVLVLDTNVVLDLFVYEDPATVPLRAALAEPQTRWLTTAVMREELRRVLAYPQVVKRLNARALMADAVLASFDACAQLVDIAPKAPYTCKDADDQQFIDLAVAHRAALLSKDKAVLCMTKRLATLGVAVSRQWAPVAIQSTPTTA
ncbi:MAG: putative toxin-antitoxin system toxin component, PIN family [Hydrogenophaga sp.]|uniref:putative toxin-antitoxin system toxin component, PIN family n=1 Tax=Hydrogenophaga sp. TaxID=1904254 RepID=UPI0025BA44BE|nr:putative toxin-antitoxin system toxin component, PIN family [Hydrogenophaga sp.]MBT9552769.1 putative toxin-antitoxin system toxin component, PIN family [Hydrogenophaga sp.]